MIGTMISHYKILDKIGEGGMGIVYKAHDTKLDRTVALKFLPSHLGTDENEKKRFINEAKAASALDHNNICSIYSIEETDDGNVFIVMAYYEGMSLREKIEQGPLPLKHVINYALQISSGLQKAHEKGIVHRDLKPANIFITKDDQIKIIDFGLARVTDRTLLTKSGTTLGTVPYMSPEQAQGAKVDHRTDIWSLGVVIFEMITGQRPFKSDYETALMYSIINEAPEPVTGLRSGVPIAIENIILKCLEKDHQNRYQRVDELIVDIRRMEREISSGSRRIESETGKEIKDISRGVGVPVRKIPAVVYVLPVLLFAAVAGYLFYPKSTIIAEIERSIAVLPFENLSPDPDDRIFSDGITEDIISSLSKISDMRVISRYTSMRYKDSDKPLGTIGDELNVSALLLGSIRRSGDVFRISVQLIDVQTDFTLWSEHYDRRIEDLFAMQSEVAQMVAAALQSRLTSVEIERIETLPTDNPAAYELFRMARHRFNDLSRETLDAVTELYHMAIELDPEFALAHAELSFAYRWLRNLGDTAADERAWNFAHRALELDSTLAFGHFVHANNLASRGHYSEARTAHLRTLQYDPNESFSMMNLSVLEYNLGRIDESLYWARRGLERSPDQAISYHHVGLPLTALGNDDITERFLRIGLEKETVIGPYGEFGPKPLPRIPIRLADLSLLRGNDEEAVRWVREALELRPDNEELLRAYGSILLFTRSMEADSVVEMLYHRGYVSASNYALLLMNRGETEKAMPLLTDALQTDMRRYEEGHEDPRIPLGIAGVYALMGDENEALDWLEQAYHMGYRMYRVLERNPQFDNIRNHTGYRRLVERMKADIARMRTRADFSGLPGWEEYGTKN
jgi:serine/threonine protein kinase/tetratricopeptide (TPR) repeat protein